MKIQALRPNFQLPTRGTPHSAGFDIYMPEAGSVKHGEKLRVTLGFATEIPEDSVAFLLPRSGAGSKGLELVNTCGVIDADYRGEWIANLTMGLPGEFRWEAGERILQLVVTARYRGGLELVESVQETERGAGGFGSTGS